MKKKQFALFWIVAIGITLSAVIFQRMTGPTNPKRVNFILGDTSYSTRLSRSLNTDNKGMKVRIQNFPESIGLSCRYQLYPEGSVWDTIQAVNANGVFVFHLPTQPPAGKLSCFISAELPSGETVVIHEEPLIIRFKDPVSAWLLIPHILLMFAAMLFSNLSGLLAFARKDLFYRYAKLTLICLFAGGLIFGPIIQKLAFGDFWTGWPLGGDLTDNKTVLMFLVWLVAVWLNRKKTRQYIWAVVAALIMLLAYSIPHSTLGSTYDHNAGKVVTGR